MGEVYHCQRRPFAQVRIVGGLCRVASTEFLHRTGYALFRVTSKRGVPLACGRSAPVFLSLPSSPSPLVSRQSAESAHGRSCSASLGWSSSSGPGADSVNDPALCRVTGRAPKCSTREPRASPLKTASDIRDDGIHQRHEATRNDRFTLLSACPWRIDNRSRKHTRTNPSLRCLSPAPIGIVVRPPPGTMTRLAFNRSTPCEDTDSPPEPASHARHAAIGV